MRGLKLMNVTLTVIQRKVAPYVGAWIETSKYAAKAQLQASHPTWVRGLKLLFSFFDRVELSRTLRGCVD